MKWQFKTKRRNYRGKNSPTCGLHLFGKKARRYIDGRSIKIIKCIDCNKKLSIHAFFQGSKRCGKCCQIYYYKTHPEAKIRQSKIMLKRLKNPKNHPNWKGGTSRLPYPYIFRKRRVETLFRDSYKCLLCKKDAKYVHHIDYCKNNCNLKNLISLCNKCHAKTNSNRDYWFAYFTYIMENFIYG
jgi:5-methylcytosine-specific restriction endonuclease McrA